MGNEEDAKRIIKDQKLQELQVMISLRDLLGESFVPENPPLGLPLLSSSPSSPPQTVTAAIQQDAKGSREEGRGAGGRSRAC